MAVLYADTSALVKLVLEEAESAALHSYLEGVELASCELVLTELPRAIHRRVALDSHPSRDSLYGRASDLIDALILAPVDELLLAAAGALAEPDLRSLDAIHLVAALGLYPIDDFVTYDKRQADAARLVGLRTCAPSA